MEQEQLIPATEFCLYHKVDIHFIDSLSNSNLIECTIINEEIFIPVRQLSHLEKLVNLHYELEINLQGIEAITHLLNQINAMKLTIHQLNNKLSLYE